MVHEWPRISPEEAARRLGGDPEEARRYVDAFGPTEIKVEGQTYTVWPGHRESRPGPEALAAGLVSHVHDHEPEPESFLVRVVAEVLGIAPAVRERLVDLLMADLKEEIARLEDPRFSRATIALIENIEDEWKNRS